MGQVAAKDSELMSILLASNSPSAWANVHARVSLPSPEGRGTRRRITAKIHSGIGMEQMSYALLT